MKSVHHKPNKKECTGCRCFEIDSRKFSRCESNPPGAGAGEEVPAAQDLPSSSTRSNVRLPGVPLNARALRERILRFVPKSGVFTEKALNSGVVGKIRWQIQRYPVLQFLSCILQRRFALLRKKGVDYVPKSQSPHRVRQPRSSAELVPGLPGAGAGED